MSGELRQFFEGRKDHQQANHVKIEIRICSQCGGRTVPTFVNGKEQIPFQGVGKYIPKGVKATPSISSCAQFPADGNKIVGSLREALEIAGLRDGMTISSHHHFRNGDLVMNRLFDEAKAMGAHDLMWFPSAAFPCHAP